MSLYRYQSAFITFINVAEAFLSEIDDDPEHKDKKGIYKRLKIFEKRFPDLCKYFKYYAESSEDPKTLIHEAIDLRNIIVHSSSPSGSESKAAEAILKTALPLVQSLYKCRFNDVLIDRLIENLDSFFSVAFYLRKNFDLVGNDWVRSLAPISWKVQSIVSPNYAPKYYLWDSEGYGIDKGEAIFNSLSQKCSKEGLEVHDNQFCPICNELSIGLKITVTTDKMLEFTEAHCVNCQLELDSSPVDKAITQALFDSFITENEPRLRKEYGLD